MHGLTCTLQPTPAALALSCFKDKQSFFKDKQCTFAASPADINATLVFLMQATAEAESLTCSNNLISLGTHEPQAADVFAASLKLTYFEFVLACVGISQAVVNKDQPALAKVLSLSLHCCTTLSYGSLLTGKHLATRLDQFCVCCHGQDIVQCTVNSTGA